MKVKGFKVWSDSSSEEDYPSRDAAQKMLKTCEIFTAENNIIFSTHEDAKKNKSKTLYIVGPNGAALIRPLPLELCGHPLPCWLHWGGGVAEEASGPHRITCYKLKGGVPVSFSECCLYTLPSHSQ